MKYKINILVLFLIFIIFFRFSESGQHWFKFLSNQSNFFLPIIVAAALIDSFNPCAFSILFLTIGFLFSLGQMRSDILKIGSAYIFGLFIVYLLIGLGILQAFNLFNIPNFMAKVGALLLIVLGAVNIINSFFPDFPLKFGIPQSTHQRLARLINKASLAAAFVLGFLVGLFEFPCTGGAYLMILGLLHDTATYLSGFGYLIIYNLIFVLPLVLILLIASNENLLTKVQQWQKNHRKKMHFYTGLAMIILGIIIFLL